jgi:hypothetical protein
MDELRMILRKEVYASPHRNGLPGPTMQQGGQIKYCLFLIFIMMALLAGLLFGLPVEHSINASALLTQNPGNRSAGYTARFKQPTPLLAKARANSHVEILSRPGDKASSSRTMRVTDVGISGNNMALHPLGDDEPVIGNNTPVIIRLALRSPSLWVAITGGSLATHSLNDGDF